VSQEQGMREFLLATWGIDTLQGEGASQTVQALVRFVTVLFSDIEFETIWQLIFETLVKALRLLRTFGPADRDSLPISYAELLTPAVVKDFTFEAFLGYLNSSGLVAPTQDNSNRLHLTDKGQAFLDFIERRQKPPKPS